MTASPAAIDAILAEAVASGEAPGVVAMAANADGVFYEGAFGRRERKTGAAMTRDTIFRIASMTKAVTSVAAMQLVEQGRLRLDQPVGKIMPELAAPKVLDGFEPGGAPRLRPARRPITLRHLLTHTSGFGYDWGNVDLLRYAKRTHTPNTLSAKLTSLDLPLVFDPGERWEYGIGTDWVGRIVETVSGQTLDAYFEDHIFAPLGMKDSGFAAAPAQLQHLVGIEQRNADGSFSPISVATPVEREFLSGGGGLLSTAPDYIALLRMLLHEGIGDGGERVLQPQTVRQMAQNQIGELNAGVIHTAMRERANDLDLFPGMKCKWGLGFLINPEPGPNGRNAGSLTWAGIYNSYYWLDPAAGIAAVIMMQILPFADPRALRLYGAFERAVYTG
jgi:methyl acetate hydrolase